MLQPHAKWAMRPGFALEHATPVRVGVAVDPDSRHGRQGALPITPREVPYRDATKRRCAVGATGTSGAAARDVLRRSEPAAQRPLGPVRRHLQRADGHHRPRARLFQRQVLQVGEGHRRALRDGQRGGAAVVRTSPAQPARAGTPGGVTRQLSVMVVSALVVAVPLASAAAGFGIGIGCASPRPGRTQPGAPRRRAATAPACRCRARRARSWPKRSIGAWAAATRPASSASTSDARAAPIPRVGTRVPARLPAIRRYRPLNQLKPRSSQ